MRPKTTKKTKLTGKQKSQRSNSKLNEKKQNLNRPNRKIKSKDVWPLSRNVLFRPERYNYIKKLIPDTGCVFCKAAQNEISFENLCVYKSKYSMILLNKFPYNSGHLLILPQRHCGDYLQFNDVELEDLNRTVKMAIQAVTEIYSPAGFNLGLNHGSVSGAGIPEHMHFHIVPRWAGDLNFFPLIAETKVVIETLEKTYEAFLSYFKKVDQKNTK